MIKPTVWNKLTATSPATVNKWQSYANLILIIGCTTVLIGQIVPKAIINIPGALAVLIGTIAFNILGSIKECHFNSEIEEAKRAAEADRSARIAIEEGLKPRNIAEHDALKLASMLRHLSTFAEKPIPSAIFPTGDTHEQAVLADQLEAAFAKAGFKINRNSVTYGKPYLFKGIGVLTSEDPEAVERGNKISEALQKIGLAAIRLPNRYITTQEPNAYDQAVSICVGDRP
jgi:hypothetical protein